MAPGGENNIPPTCLVIIDDQDGADQGGDAVQVESTGATVAGLSEPRTDRWPGQYAFLRWNEKAKKLEQSKDALFRFRRWCAPIRTCSGWQRPHHDFEIPQSGEDNRLNGQSDPVVVAPEQPSQLGGLVRNPSIMLSCFLATDRGTDTPTNNGENSTLEGRAESLEHRQVRLLANPGNSCYFNASLQCLLWITLCMDALHNHFWPVGGFELFRSLSNNAWLPLCLRSFRPLVWLLGHGWQEGDLYHQQDACEFLQWFLARTMPPL